MGRIGIMGGTFDPIHNGHLMLGEQAYGEYGLDEVWYMPSGQPPHKKDHKITEAEDRCRMTELAIRRYPYFRLSDMEVNRQGNTYTAQTLKLLKESRPEDEIFFIVGADSLYELESWFHPEEVLGLTTLIVAEREYEKAKGSLDARIKYLENKYLAKILKLHSREMDISSQLIRERIQDGKPIDDYVPEVVEDYIKRHHLYTHDQRENEYE